MNFRYSSVRTPRWATSDHSAILCVVKFDHLKQEVEFTASPKDSELHCREIYKDCMAGKYGPIDEFKAAAKGTPTSPPAPEIQPLIFDRWPEIHECIAEANRENAAGTIRGQVLVWSSIVELLIRRLVDTFLIEHQITQKLIDGPLFPFSARINTAFSLGLISKSEHKSCDNIRVIRNHVAHRWSVTLDAPKVQSALRSLYDADHSNTLEWIEENEFLIKMVYSGSCAALALRLAERQKAAEDAKRVQLEDA